MDMRVRPLDAKTWKDFERLALRHNGVWGGCWCMAFHPEGVGKGHTVEGNREAKRRRVLEGKAHAALVYPDELPRIKMRREYEARLRALPDWRITCFFVAPDFRARGVASHALDGALDIMKGMGGGLVESYPQDAGEARAGASFLYNATLGLFESRGFDKVARLGKNHWVVNKRI
ncbi:MAG: hypothetical protein Q8M76_19225 [Spirochaetaceae bacterium]|nr:hypothetical protein [Spirochaetaceae bacterium]